jgi:hypothetical protein
MAGLGINAGFFLGGLGQGFVSAFNQSSELKLKREHEENAKKRDLMERADNDRHAMFDVLDKYITTAYAAGKTSEDMANDPFIGHATEQLRSLTKSSGRNVEMLTPMLSMMLHRPTASQYMGLHNGTPERQQQQAQQAQYETNPLAFDQGTAPASFTDSYGQRSATPGTFDQGPVGPQSIQPPIGPEHAEFQTSINNLTHAMALAVTPGEKEAYAIQLREAVHEKLTAGTDHIDTHWYKDSDGNEHAAFVNKRTRQIMDEHGNPWESQTSKGGDSDIGRIVDAIEAGRQPPVLTGFYRKKSAIMAEAERRGLDLTEMGLQYSAAQTEVKSLNGPQMVRFAGTAKAVLKTGQRVIDLAEELHNGGVNWLNAIELEGIRKNAGNTELGTKIAGYQTAVAGYKSELAQTEKGGYDPTAEAFKLADKQIDENYGYLQMKAAVQESRRIIGYRLHAIPNWETLGPGSTTNRYIPGGGSGTDQGEQPPPAAAGGLQPAAPATDPAPDLKPGDIYRGNRWKGGDKSDPKNWEKL